MAEAISDGGALTIHSEFPGEDWIERVRLCIDNMPGRGTDLSQY
jgi:hypothetical protein